MRCYQTLLKRICMISKWDLAVHNSTICISQARMQEREAQCTVMTSTKAWISPIGEPSRWVERVRGGVSNRKLKEINSSGKMSTRRAERPRRTMRKNIGTNLTSSLNSIQQVVNSRVIWRTRQRVLITKLMWRLSLWTHSKASRLSSKWISEWFATRAREQERSKEVSLESVLSAVAEAQLLATMESGSDARSAMVQDV